MKIHFLHVMRRKPCFHDGTVTTNPDKNRLIKIPPSSGEKPDGRIDKGSVSI